MKSEWKTGMKAGTTADNFLKKSLSSNYFTYQQIFEMLVPLIMDQFFVSIIGLLTTAMISSSSQESVSAVSLVSPIYAVTYAIFSSISAAGTVIIAQYKGNGNMNMVKKAAGQIVMFTVVSAIFFSIVLSFFAGSLIDAMFADADICVKNKATEYLIGCAISCIFLSLYMGCVAVFRGIGQTKICLKLSMIINLIHLFASFIFINILQLDIIGTSLSLNLARVIGGGVALYCLLGEKSGLGIRLKDIMRINGSILTSVIQTSIPFAMEQLCFNGGAILVSMFIVKLGTKSVAANAVANSTVAVFYAMGLAVSNLAVPVVGQCIGAGDRRMAKNDLAWRVLNFIVISSYGSIFKINIRVISGSGGYHWRYIQTTGYYNAANGIILVNIQCASKCIESSGRCEIYFLCFAWGYVDSTCRIKLSGIYKIRCRYCGGMDLSGYGMADPKHYIFTPVSFRKMVKNTLLKHKSILNKVEKMFYRFKTTFKNSRMIENQM